MAIVVAAARIIGVQAIDDEWSQWVPHIETYLVLVPIIVLLEFMCQFTMGWKFIVAERDWQSKIPRTEEIVRGL